MSILNAIILGVVQGLTEFLPVSSSGHLVILQNLMGLTNDSLEFAIVLHMGTFLAVIIAYYGSFIGMFKEFFMMLYDIITLKGPCLKKSKYRYYVIFIIIASIPAGIVGVFFDDYISAAFSSLTIVSFTLAITGILLLIGDRVGKNNSLSIEKLGPSKSFFVGLCQMVAIMPGISRSGSTIVGGLFSGLKREDAVEFSFLMSLPATLGALLLKITDITQMGINMSLAPLIFGLLSSLIVGYLSIKLLVAIVQKGSLMIFSIYCFALSALLIMLNFF